MSDKKDNNDEPRGPGGPGGATVVERKSKTQKPRMFNVLLHNDDYTTMEFVVWVLQSVFHRSQPEATRIMLTIHNKGVGVAGVYTREVAVAKANKVQSIAESHEYPLKASVEPAA